MCSATPAKPARLAHRLLIALGRGAGAAGRRDPHPQPWARPAHVSATAPVIADLPLIFDTRGGRRLVADMHTIAARNDGARTSTVAV